MLSKQMKNRSAILIEMWHMDISFLVPFLMVPESSKVSGLFASLYILCHKDKLESNKVSASVKMHYVWTWRKHLWMLAKQFTTIWSPQMLMYNNLWSKKSSFKVMQLHIWSIQLTYRRLERKKSKREGGKQKKAFARGTCNSKKDEIGAWDGSFLSPVGYWEVFNSGRWKRRQKRCRNW